MNNFSKLGLSKQLVKVLDSLDFTEPTPVQKEAIPMLLQNDPTDFIGLAQTGTGKTAAFGLPLIDLIDGDSKDTQALIMAPTRELGQQTGKQLVDFSAGKLNIEVVYGGAAIINQIKALKKPTQIVVATPGRLLDLIKRKAIKLDAVRYVVMDEADEMLNMGFQEAMDEILSYMLQDRVTWLFSATMPPEIKNITKKYMDKPMEVSVNAEQKSNKDITHAYVITKTGNKFAAIRRFLDQQPDMRGIMFCRTKRETQQLTDDFSNLGYGVEALHGDLSQAQRDAAMKRFKARSMQLLIATDVAARGIDVSNLTHVMHHKLPDQLEAYTHRSGRTGRAGKKGISLAFINPRESRRIEELEKKLKVTFKRMEVPGLEELKSSRMNSWAHLIVTTKVDPQAEGILNELKSQFTGLSKDDILKRLITSQLDHLSMQSNEAEDLNETVGGSPNKRDKSKFNQFFVNIGNIDGVTKGDLLHLLSDITNVDRKYFGTIEMQKNRSYVEIDAKYAKGISKNFDGMEIDGRAIRMNLEDGTKKREKEQKSTYKPHKKRKKDFRRSRKKRR